MLFLSLNTRVNAESNPNNRSEEIRVFRTPSERRDAEQTYELTEWLEVSALAEFELDYIREIPRSGSRISNNSSALDIQLGAIVEPLDWFKTEVIFDYDVLDDDPVIDEVVFELDFGNVSVELGKLYTPFGEYFSNFATSPLVEFGETRDQGGIVSFDLTDKIELKIFSYKGSVEQPSSSISEMEWGAVIAGEELAGFNFSVGLTSDLADSLESLLGDDVMTQEHRVPAGHLFLYYNMSPLEFSLEFLSALDEFDSLESDKNRPLAWNFEIASLVSDSHLTAIRLEGSDELEGGPKWRTGVSFAWLINKHLTWSVEYLYGEYRAGLAETRNEELLDSDHRLLSTFIVQF